MAREPKKPRSGNGWGGKRPGAGRKPRGSATAPQVAAKKWLYESETISSEPPAEIDLAARERLRLDSRILAIFDREERPSVRIKAAKSLLDVGYGRPAVEIGGDAAMLPFMTAPRKEDTAASVYDEVRAQARKYAVAAIDLLRELAQTAPRGADRVAAEIALQERALGLIAPARTPEEQRARPLGKKEELARAAEIAATGAFATPPPPKRT